MLYSGQIMSAEWRKTGSNGGWEKVSASHLELGCYIEEDSIIANKIRLTLPNESSNRTGLDVVYDFLSPQQISDIKEYPEDNGLFQLDFAEPHNTHSFESVFISKKPGLSTRVWVPRNQGFLNEMSNLLLQQHKGQSIDEVRLIKLSIEFSINLDGSVDVPDSVRQ